MKRNEFLKSLFGIPVAAALPDVRDTGTTVRSLVEKEELKFASEVKPSEVNTCSSVSIILEMPNIPDILVY